MSLLIILPKSPVPLTRARLIFLSSANFFARGEAMFLPLLGADFSCFGVDLTSTFGASFTTSVFTSLTGASAFLTSTFSSSVFALSCSSKELMSSPFSPRIANILSTGALAPSTTPICSKKPS